MLKSVEFSLPWSGGLGKRGFSINTMSIKEFSSSQQGPEPGCVLKSQGATDSLNLLIWSPSWRRRQFNKSFICFSLGRSWAWFPTVDWPGEGEWWEDLVASRLSFAWTPMRAPVCFVFRPLSWGEGPTRLSEEGLFSRTREGLFQQGELKNSIVFKSLGFELTLKIGSVASL